MIETADGLSAVDEIAATPGLDGVFVGPADLSLAMGIDTFADLTDAALLQTLDTIVETANRHGITPGIHAPSPRTGRRDGGARLPVHLLRRGHRSPP